MISLFEACLKNDFHNRNLTRMKPFSRITLQQRKGYREVFIYYSRHGVKFRESTAVKILDQDIFDLEGVLTENSNLAIIRKTHRQVEDVILRYIRQYNEKPPVQWLRIEFHKVKVRNLLFPELEENVRTVEGEEADISVKDEKQCKPEDAGQDLFVHWEDFILLKRQTIRNEGTIKRYNSLLVTTQKCKERYANTVSHDWLGIINTRRLQRSATLHDKGAYVLSSNPTEEPANC